MNRSKYVIRTPIVCVLGHVDHGKTSLLDKIRGSSIQSKEAGFITQHIGATEIPIKIIKDLCGVKLHYKVPGLLFIDTPGHHAFTTLRNRGGALADLAILVVDITEGFKPQTIESLNILRNYKTPFVVAANKIDKIEGWRPYKNAKFLDSYDKQSESSRKLLDDRLYMFIGQLYDYQFSADRFDKIRDFSKNICVVPISAKTGEGVADLLLVLVGLAQRFLEESLKIYPEGPAEGVVVEVKEEKGLGTTINAIIYDGELKIGDTIILSGRDNVFIETKVRALLKTEPGTDIRFEKKFKNVKKVNAAAGIKIVAPNLENAMAGSPIMVVSDERSVDEIKKEIDARLEKIMISTDKDGVIVKADTIGSLDAIINELSAKNISIKMANLGNISKRDIIEADIVENDLYAVIIGFNVDILPNASEYLKQSNVKVFTGDVIYQLIDEYTEWIEEQEKIKEQEKVEAIVKPGIIEILPNCIFRSSKPAIVGVKVLAGSIKTGVTLINKAGKYSGKIKQIQDKNENLKIAGKNQEVAISIESVIVGRHIKERDTLYVDIPEKHAKIIEEELYGKLSADEIEAFNQFISLKRKDNPFWAK
ncbi:translation initiation factor IF-2 [Candidatus Methanoliparum sp. LAM-1]|nr:translation initiation factor IF-2 [Candidatus Methanoliparum sp. LAM-1]